MKRYFAVAFLIISSACSKESVITDHLPTPFCAWRFKNQDYVAMMGAVNSDSASSVMFYTQDTIYPFNTLNYFTLSVNPGEYTFGPASASSNSLVYNTSVNLDSMTAMTADTGVIYIRSLTNSYISSDFIAVFGSDILSGHCDNLKLQ